MSIGKILGIITAIPAVIFGLVQLYLIFTVGTVAWKMDKAMKPEQARKGAFPFPVEHTKLRGNYTQRGFLAMSNADRYHPSRLVTASIPVEVKALLQPGETAPEKDFEEVFVKARAVKLAEAECDALEMELASQCKVERTYVREYKGDYTLTMTLQFVQQQPFFPALDDGTVQTEGVKYSYQELSQDLALKDKGDRAMPSQMARHRAKFYARAVRQCDKLRSRAGNCAISNISISTRKDYKSTAWLMTGKVTLSWLDAQSV